MSAYVVVNVDVNDPEMFNRYREVVTPLVMNSGGKYLAVDFDGKDLDGESRQGLAIVEFESVKAAEEFYNSPAYQEAIGLRLNSTTGWLRVVPELVLPT